MTTAILPYSRETSDGRLSAGLWAAGLCVSLAVHFLVLVYGPPDLAPPEPLDEPKPLETEIILETGGPLFDNVASVETDPQTVTEPEALKAAEAAETDQIAETVAAETAVPVTSEAVAASPVALESVAEHVTEPLVETPPLDTDQSIEPLVTEPIIPFVAEPTPTVEAIEAVETIEPAGIVEETDVAAVDAVNIAETPLDVIGVITDDAATTPPEVAGRVGPVEVVTALPDEQSAPETVPLSSNDAVQDLEEVVTAVGVEAASSDPVTTNQTEQIEVVETVAAVSSDVSVALAPDNTAQAEQVSAVETVPVVSADGPVGLGIETTVAVPEVVRPPAPGAGPVPVTVPEPVIPEPVSSNGVVVDQQIASVDPLEGVDALAPTDLEPEPVPNAPQTTVEPDTVAPADVETLDPTERIESYVAAYQLGDCAHLTVQSAGADTALITAFGASIAPFVMFDQRFSQDQGFDASIEVRIVTRPQCQLLNALGFYQGIEVADLISLNKTLVRSGTAVSGVIGRDLPIGKIAIAEQNGVDLTGRGPPELYLVDDAGQIHDGRAYILPETNPGRAGGWKFAIPVTMLSAGNEETALVLAVWNRPKGKQPGKFGKLPASRISSVLDQPGVYSLAAFKVTR